MTARTTSAQLIDRLRTMTQAGTADWTLGTAIFWDGDHMQAALDAHRLDIYRAPMQPIPKYTAGTVAYYEYQAPYGNYEQTSGGTSIFVIEDGIGTDQGTAGWSADYLRGKVTFTADRKGTIYYLTGRVYDLNGAAADIWRAKANHYAVTHFDFSTDNMKVNRKQVVDNCLSMADKYTALAWSHSETMYRGDEV